MIILLIPAPVVPVPVVQGVAVVVVSSHRLYGGRKADY